MCEDFNTYTSINYFSGTYFPKSMIIILVHAILLKLVTLNGNLTRNCILGRVKDFRNSFDWSAVRTYIDSLIPEFDQFQFMVLKTLDTNT